MMYSLLYSRALIPNETAETAVFVGSVHKTKPNQGKTAKDRQMIVIFLLFIAPVSAQCTEENNCEQIDLPATKDQVRFQRDSSLEGHVLVEHTTPNSFSCFLKCIDNCQCLSFNFKSDDGSNVANRQLNEAASYTNPESIKPKGRLNEVFFFS